MQSAEASRARAVAVASLLTALVFVVTAGFTVYIPETRGYFNLGEAAVYISALLLPPLWAALAGGVGSMLADVALGYLHYAPATLVIKGCEGLVASLLLRRRPRGALAESRVLGVAASLLLPLLLALLGSLFYTGTVELALPLTPVASVGVGRIIGGVWVAAAAALAAYIVYANLRGLGTAWTILSMTLAGIVMVTGYFIYEQAILGVAAAAEVPFNLMQAL
ncbi:MAG: ECF transporter S component, partial [Thermoproteales archaeon]|nr:ECF transporter S component [Thermoproteales archaeon]